MNNDKDRQVLISPDRLMSISAAAAELGTCTRTVRRYITKGLIKAYEEGKSRKPVKRPRQLNLGFGSSSGEDKDA